MTTQVKAVRVLLWIGILATLATPAFAETRTISWNPVTTYTDGTLIEAGKTITYSAYWTPDAGLSLASLHTLGTALATTSATFDPTGQGMTRGGTVYFTTKAVLNTGEESTLSPAYSWVVPPVTPPPPATLTSIAVSGPSSVNEGATGTFTATATWSDSSTTSVTPTWSASLGTISAAGLFTAPSVTANQTATIGASYTSGGVTRTASAGVSVVNVTATLTSIAVSGPSSVNEGATGTFTATATWSDSSTTSVTPTWSASLGTISAAGLFTAPSVTANQTATIGASYTSGGVTRTASAGVSVVNVTATLTSIAVSGPSSVNEGATGTFTATATWSDSSTTSVTPTWSASLGTISAAGLFTAPSVTANQTASIGASYTSGGVTRTASAGVSVVNVAATLTSIAVSGPSSVNEGATGTFTATATWSDSSTTSVTPTWSASLGTISAAGLFTAPSVTANQTATIGASYTSGGVTRTASRSVTVVNVAATLSSIAASGPSSVNEGATGTFTATATWSDSSTTSITPTWSASLGTISAAGLFTAPSVTASQTASIGASYTSGGVTRTASRFVTVVNAAATLTSIAVSGPSSVNEGATGTFTATATWSDSSTTSITPTWSASLGTISAAGLFTAPSVTANQTASIGASYTSGGVTRTASAGVSVVNAAETLTSIAVSGPSSVNEGATATYSATGTWDNGTTAAINPTWSENSSYVTIGTSGVLTASAVTANQAVTVTATYGGRTGTMSVTIVDVPVAAPAAPKNIGIAGPTSSVSPSSASAPTGSPEIYRLSWDPVTTNLDGSPIEPGRTVRYTAYWTDDPALSAGSLRSLASLISGAALDFDPSANQMAKNQVVFLTVRAILDTGDESPLSASLTWRVENAGPVPPEKGKIIKK